MKKVSKSILMILCLSVALTGTALAQGGGNQSGIRGGGGWGGPCVGNGAWNLSAEQRATYDKIMQEYDAKVTPLRDQMWAKHTELQALSANPKTEPATISKLVNEMSDLRVKFRQEREALSQRLEKELGITSGFGRGGFHGDGGFHGGGFHGGMGRGMGGMSGGMGGGCGNCY